MVAGSRSRTRAEAAAEKRTTRSAAVAAAAGQNSENVNAIPKAATLAGSSKSASAKHQAPGKKSQSQTKPKSSSTAASVAVSALRKSTSKDVEGEVFCSCKGRDDGSPMIKCDGQCNMWYHLRCIDILEEDAGEIDAYFCPNCEAKLGVKTVMDWEGPDAFIKIGNARDAMKAKPKLERKATRTMKDAPEDDESDESDDGSEDDYVAEAESRAKSAHAKRSARRLSFSSEKSASDSESDRPRRIARRGAVSEKASAKRSKGPLHSPVVGDAAAALKRRGSLLASSSSKKARTTSNTPAGDDPMRKYCLSKLNEIIRPMFVEYREAEKRTFASASFDLAENGIETETEKPNFELTDEENKEIEQNVSAFVTQLEACMMDEYAEPDKTGRPTAGGKYKERFRMLSFNLAKEDRVVLRKGIASGRITPAQLNTMSSTDLANEQTKAEIEAAEEEALEHSIMPKLQAPSAKMTHKGIEMIEENISETRNREDSKQEEDGRIEIERRERVRVARERQRSASMVLPPTPVDANAPASAGPHSPNRTTGPSGAWGAPPPLPISPGHPSFPFVPGRPPAQPLFAPSDSDYSLSLEGELALADLINIDDDLPPDISQNDASLATVAPQPLSDASSASTSTPEVVTPSGPSPFAGSKPLSPTRRTSFDLNALWTGGNEPTEMPPEEGDSRRTKIVVNNDVDEGEAMDIDSADEDSEERILDAILDDVVAPSADPSSSSSSSPPPIKLDLNLLPKVWSGTLSMPYDANVTIAPSVIAKQIGGRSLTNSSSAWKALFPSPDARVDGRVPVPNSSQYLINMRLNATKELVAVCLQPESEEHFAKFNELFGFLVNKSRHGLIFPWGMHPKPDDPGRELYIIPLKRDEPIPEYIELLDNLQLPTDRPDDVIVGVFVLSKGKLKDDPDPTVPSAELVQPRMPPPPNVVSTPPASQPPPPISSLLANLPQVPGVDQTALAAEVMSLTPEQISLMLRSLSQTVPAPAPVPVLPSALPMVGASPLPRYPPSLAMPPFAPNFPHSAPQRSPQGRSTTRPSPGRMGARNEYDDRYERRPHEKDEGGRGGRGRGHRPPRSQGRGRPHDNDMEHLNRDRDSGWRGRGRG